MTRKLSKIQPTKYKESKQVRETHKESNVFFALFREDRISAAIVFPMIPKIATTV